MTTSKPKEKINWYYILIGLFIIFLYFYSNDSPVNEVDLDTKIITLYRDIEFIKGRSGRYGPHHRIWSNESQAAFIIDSHAGTASSEEPLDSLRKGDTIKIKYYSSRENDLENKAKDISVYFLQKGKTIYFDTNMYNKVMENYQKRSNWLMTIGAVLLMLRGLTIIKSKTAYTIGGISFVIIISLIFLHRF